VERGRLSLDLAVEDFAPGAAEAGATLRHVLSHVTVDGRFVHDAPRYDAVAGAIKLCTQQTLRLSLVDQLFDRIAMQRSVPGHDFASWSQSTVAQFSGATVARFGDVMTQLARPHRAQVRGRPTPTTFAPTNGLTGSSGAVTTAHDLALFQSALDSGVLLRAETLVEAWTPPMLASGRLSPHGLGWFVELYEGQPVAWQFGVVPEAYSALIITLPHRGVTLILLANSDGLVEPFPLSGGDITTSPFARLFLRLLA
jgi:CubicO group peptidase (beta-lactamase class C family)